MFPDKLRVSSFLDIDSYNIPGQRQSSHFVGSRAYAGFGVTYHPHFWQNDRGLSRATAVYGTPTHGIKSQHTKLTLEKNILPPLLAGFELATF